MKTLIALSILAIFIIPYCACLGNDKVDSEWHSDNNSKGYTKQADNNFNNEAYSKLYKHMVRYGY